jgi:hypothetical protein
VGHLLGGWQINGTYRYSSGQPWTVLQGAGQGLCDPTNFTGTSGFDACRPFLGSAGTPFNLIGQICDGTLATCPVGATGTAAEPVNTLVNVNAGCIGSGGTAAQCGVTPINAAHFIINNLASAQLFGTPFSPLGRDTARGQPISTVNMGVFKNVKISERFTLQFQADAFNVFNHMWLGIPSVNVNTASFGNRLFNPDGGDDFAGNNTTDGILQRRLQFGGKIIF